MRFGIIGTNFITDWFLAAALSIKGVSLAAVYSRSLERAQAFAKKYGAPLAFDSLEQLANCGEVDAVYIASPNALHCEQAVQMLRAKKHVLVEKPIASNSAELERMFAAAWENGVVLLEALRHIHTPGLGAIREKLAEIGPVRRVSFVKNQYSSRYDKYKAGVIENAFDPKLSNGALMDLGVYCVSLLVALFGAPSAIHAEALMLKSGVDGQGFVLARYDEMLAELSFSKISDCFVPSVIQGERGSILIPELTTPERAELVLRGGERAALGQPDDTNTMTYEVEHFIEIIDGRRDIAFYTDCSRCTIKLIDEARRQMGLRFPADAPEKETQ